MQIADCKFTIGSISQIAHLARRLDHVVGQIRAYAPINTSYDREIRSEGRHVVAFLDTEADFVLGRIRDELDVEYVVMYELVKPDT